MSPTFKEGDKVFYKKYLIYKSNLKVGQVVIFKHPIQERIQIKRIKQIKENCIEVIGDNSKYSNDSKSFGFVQNEKIIGIVTSKIINF
tara:strand:- start:106 stop:369 length:264 start_codon:yes stop_codon:yes gene_type:complete